MLPDSYSDFCMEPLLADVYQGKLVDADLQNYYKTQYGMLDYQISYFNKLTQKIDLCGKKVLELGGSHHPKELVLDLCLADSWVCVDKPWIYNELSRNHFNQFEFFKFNEHPLQDSLKLNNYLIYYENAEDMPLDFMDSFDICVSFCSFEHMYELPLVFDKIYGALKQNGILYSSFDPIWSQYNGAHVRRSKTGLPFDFDLNNMPESMYFSHLYMGYAELYKTLTELYTEDIAKKYTYYLKNSNLDVNRMFYEDYAFVLHKSCFSKKHMKPHKNIDISSVIKKRLTDHYPKYSHFNACGIEIHAIKQQNKGVKQMEKLKRVINCIIPVSACNLKCSYCYISQMGADYGTVTELKYPPEYIAKALSSERLGGVCLINLCGSGETMIPPYIVKLTEQLLIQGHHCCLFTNGTITEKLDELIDLPAKLRRRLVVHFSYHHLSLKNKGLLDMFFSNLKRVRDAGISIGFTICTNDELVPHIPEVRKLALEHVRTLPHVLESRDTLKNDFRRLTKMSIEEHQEIWEQFDSDAFNFQKETFGKKIKEFCYGGDWFLNLFLDTGDITPCTAGGNKITNIYEDIELPLNLSAIGACPFPHCISLICFGPCGVIPSIETPYYDTMRNRTSTDSEEWLNPAIKQFYRGKLNETNAEYSKDKQSYIAALMANEYENTEYTYDADEIGSVVVNHLSRKGVRTIGIAGLGKMTEWLVRALSNTNIQIKFIFDSTAPPQPVQRVKYQIRKPSQIITVADTKIPCVTLAEPWHPVDAVIVTEYSEYRRISRCIKSNKGQKAISVLNLVD